MALNFNLNHQLQRNPSPHRLLRQTRTDDLDIRVRQTGTLFDNEGAEGAVVFNLPSNAVAGHRYAFMVKAAQELTINPGDNDGIRIDGTLEGDGLAITADSVGEYVELIRDADGNWDAINVNGTWTAEEASSSSGE